MERICIAITLFVSYSGGARFESQTRYLLLSLHGFLQLIRRNAAILLHLRHECFIQISVQVRHSSVDLTLDAV
jgi:hypothetical protein